MTLAYHRSPTVSTQLLFKGLIWNKEYFQTHQNQRPRLTPHAVRAYDNICDKPFSVDEYPRLASLLVFPILGNFLTEPYFNPQRLGESEKPFVQLASIAVIRVGAELD